MKKHLVTLLVISLITPSIAFASWWNPFSWDWRALFSPKIQVVEPVNNPITIPTPIKEIKKDAPVIKEANPITDVCINIKSVQSKVPDGYSLNSGNCTPIVVKDYCPNINGIQSKLPDGMFLYVKTGQCLTQNEIDALVSPTPQSSTTNQELSIYDISIDVSVNSGIINWKTSITSESKVILNGHEYLPQNGVGTDHSVTISGLGSATTYSGYITAISNNSWRNQNFQFTTKTAPPVPPAPPVPSCGPMCASA